jgi:hypothetical protein
MWRLKANDQIPSTKQQISSNFPMTKAPKRLEFNDWCFEFIWDL